MASHTTPVSENRAHMLTMIGVLAPGREVRGIEVSSDGVARLRLSGRAAIAMHPDGQLDWEEDALAVVKTRPCPDCGGAGTRRESACFPVETDCGTCFGTGEVDEC